MGRIESLAMTGSGVIFDTSAESAFIVTNYHVVEGVAHVDVLVDESTLYSGEVLGTDNVRDLAVSEFDVPTRTVDGWDYGFLVRDRESGQLEVVGLDDTGWFHENVDLSEDEYTTLDFGPAPSATGVTNELLLILIEEFGFFFVNQDLTATLDLSHNLESGDVSVMGAFYVEHLASPTYRNFNVWVP